MACNGVMYIPREKYETRGNKACGRQWNLDGKMVTMREICKLSGASEYTARKHIVISNKTAKEFIEFWKNKQSKLKIN